MTRHPDSQPLVFLDIDDVLCMSSPYGGFDVIEAVAGRHINPQAVYRDVFAARAREALKQIHEQAGSGLRYVISSTWREFFDRPQLCEVFRRGGLEFVADGLHDESSWRTPTKLGRGKRVDEIAQWLDQSRWRGPFLIIDDTYSGPSLRPALGDPSHPFFGRVVLCEEGVGLTAEHVAPAVAALGREVVFPEHKEQP
jgi:hypothetical protein